MGDAVFRSECELDHIRVTLLHSVTDDIIFGGRIHHSVESVVVEGRAYDVAIAAAEVPNLACVGIVVYEDTASRRNNWGGIVVKRAIEVFPG